ncbi:MAG: hypothetical protein LBT05_10560 [Planctomycetaceae bacterium]|nr:hypothetical protein [Planctomycetaceae bacterium]
MPKIQKSEASASEIPKRAALELDQPTGAREESSQEKVGGVSPKRREENSSDRALDTCQHEYVVDQTAEFPDKPDSVYIYYRCQKCNKIKMEIEAKKPEREA